MFNETSPYVFFSCKVITAPRAPPNPLRSPRLTETFAPWATSVLGVAGHPHPVLSAASCRSQELPLPPSAIGAPLENTAPLLVARSPQVRCHVSCWPDSCLMDLINTVASQKTKMKTQDALVCFLDFCKYMKRENLNVSDYRTKVA